MAGLGLFIGLRSGPALIMGMKAVLHENPSGRDYKLELVGEYSGRSYFYQIDRNDLAMNGPDYIDQVVIQFAAKIQHEERKLHYGLLGQANQPSSSHSAVAQSGGGGGGGVSFGTIYGTVNHSATFHKPHHVSSLRGGKETTAEPVKFAGFKIGELIGVRGWKIGSDGFLHSMTAGVVWAPGEPMDGKTKAKEEHCGIHAYKKARDFLKSHAAELHIYGKVAMWGDVIEHELGYRAEFAKIISLDGVLGQQRGERELTRCRERYGLTTSAA